MNIKNLGRKVKNCDEKVWNEFRVPIMRQALHLKYGQNEDILNKLLATYPKCLYEAAQNDRIWGIGYYAKEAVNLPEEQYGLNLLGECLEATRDHFMEVARNKNPISNF